MRHAANDSVATSRRAHIGLLTAAVLCVVLLAGCSSSSKSAAHTGTTAHTTSAPSTTTTAKTTTTTPVVAYRVKPGDRLTTIAKRYRVSVAAIVLANHLTDPDRLSDGQVLKIPTHPALALVITPAKGPPGQKFEFDLIGSTPAAVIRFVIASPAGKHIGPRHVVAANGSVSTRYATSIGDPPGVYKVTVIGLKGTSTKASFSVVKRP